MNGGTLRPYLKWAGGKRQLLEGIDRFVPPFTEYYEPFVGAGAVLFHLHPEKAVINDSNTQLCITYEAIRDDVDDVIGILKQHVEGNRLRGAEYFYEVRGLDRDPVAFNRLSQAEKAARPSSSTRPATTDCTGSIPKDASTPPTGDTSTPPYTRRRSSAPSAIISDPTTSPSSTGTSRMP